MESISQGIFTDVMDAIRSHSYKSAKIHAGCSSELASLTLSQRNLCDLELIMNGGFAPQPFHDKADYERAGKMRSG